MLIDRSEPGAMTPTCDKTASGPVNDVDMENLASSTCSGPSAAEADRIPAVAERAPVGIIETEESATGSCSAAVAPN